MCFLSFCDFWHNKLFKRKENKDVLFRICSVEHVDDVIKKGELRFNNPSNWDDKYEQLYLKARYIPISRNHPWADKVYCLCFSYLSPCEGQWWVYAKNGLGVELVFNRQKLLEAFNQIEGYDVYFDKVKYLSTKALDGSINKIIKKFSLDDNKHLAKLMFLKRNAFRYENEFRVILVENGKIKSKNIEKGDGYVTFKLPKDPNCNGKADVVGKYVLNIVLDPRLPSAYVPSIRKYYADEYKMKLRLIGGSHLYKPFKPVKKKI